MGHGKCPRTMINHVFDHKWTVDGRFFNFGQSDSSRFLIAVKDVESSFKNWAKIQNTFWQFQIITKEDIGEANLA